MTDPTTVTAHGLSGATLHVSHDGDVHCSVWATFKGETVVVTLPKEALREWARDVLRMTDTGPSIFDGYSDRGLMSAWDFWSDPSTSPERSSEVFPRRSRSRAAAARHPGADPMSAVVRDMGAAEYHAIKALSAGMVITLNQEYPLRARLDSPFNQAQVRENKPEFDIGTAAHLAVLEPELLAERGATRCPTAAVAATTAQPPTADISALEATGKLRTPGRR